MKRPFWGVAAAGACALICLGLLLFREPIWETLSPDRPRASEIATAPDAAKADGQPAAATRAAARTPLAAPRMTLPPPNAPLAPIFPELVRAARAGDPGAMCRLAFEMARCGPKLDQFRRNEAWFTDQLLYEELNEGQRHDVLRMLARSTSRREELEALCSGAELPADLAPWRLLRDAARGGHVPSMVRFSVEFPVEFENLLADVDALVAYRDERLGFLERAAAAGNAKAAHSLFWAYSGRDGMSLGGRVREDPIEALAYSLALDGIGSASASQNITKRAAILRRKLTPAQVGQAERRAAALVPLFAGARGSGVDLRRNLSESGEDCGATDPTQLFINAPKADTGS